MAGNRATNYGEQVERMKESMKGIFSSASREYRAVLNALEDVIRYKDQTIGAASDEMVEAHQRLGRACEEYLKTREGAKTQRGKERLDIVKAVYDLQTNESPGVNEMRNPDKLAKNIYTKWSDVLEKGRVREIDARGMDLNIVGAGSSFRTVVKDKNGKGFFTENNYLTDSKQFYTGLAEKAKSQGAKKLLMSLADQTPRGRDRFEYLAVNALKEDRISEHFENSLKKAPDILESMGLTKEDLAELGTLGEEIGKYANKMDVMFNQGKLPMGANIPMRNVASTRLALLLGQDDLLAKSERVYLNDGVTKKDGVIMAEAKGIDINSKKQEHMELLAGVNDFSDPNLLRQLTNLEIMDYLSGQVDRNPGNMFYQFETVDGQKKLTGIQGIDNDAAFGLNIEEVREMANLASIKMVDERFMKNLRGITPDVLEYTFGDILNQEEIKFLAERIEIAKETLIDVKSISPENWDKIPPEDYLSDANDNRYVNNVKKEFAKLKKEMAKENKTENAAEGPTTEAPNAGAPAAEAPTAGAPAAEAPVTGPPAAEAPTAEPPAVESPVAEAPATEAPTAEAPAAEAPTAEAPAAGAPTAEAPAAPSTAKNGRVETSLETLERAEKVKQAPAKSTQIPQRKAMMGVHREKPTIGGHRPKKQ